MGNQGIKVATLDFPGQIQMLLGHFKEHLYIPALSSEANGFFIAQCEARANQRHQVRDRKNQLTYFFAKGGKIR
jgi:hypothetical protein